MEFVLDIKRLCKELHNIEKDNGIRNFCSTSGEQYLYENVVKKCVLGYTFRFGDIDFDAFTDDDIVSIIDDKEQEIDADLCAAARIADSFEKSTALTAKTKRFF